MGAEG